MKTTFNTMTRSLISACFMGAAGLMMVGQPVPAYAQGGVESEDPTSIRIVNSRTVRVGYVRDQEPFSYEKDGNPAGFAIDMCEAVVKELKTQLGDDIKATYVALDAGGGMQAFQQQKIDMLCADTPETLTTRQKLTFSIPFYFDGLTAMVSDSASAQVQSVFAGEIPKSRPTWRATIADILKDVPIVVVEGSEADTWLADSIAQFKLRLTVQKVADNAAAIAAMKDGSAVAYFANRSVLSEELVKQDMTGGFKISPADYTRDPIGVAFARPAPAMALVADMALSELYKSGEVFDIYARYFGDPDAAVRKLYGLAALRE